MLKVRYTATFKRDFKAISKRGYDQRKFEVVVDLLMRQHPLPEKNRDHPLGGNWVGYRECHILPDWLLIYKVENDILTLTLARTGSHSDLF